MHFLIFFNEKKYLFSLVHCNNLDFTHIFKIIILAVTNAENVNYMK